MRLKKFFRKRAGKALAAFLTLLLFIFVFNNHAVSPGFRTGEEPVRHDPDNPEFVPGEILVKFKDDVNIRLQKVGGTIKTTDSMIDALNARLNAIEMEKVFKTAVKPDVYGMITVKGKRVKVPNLSNIYKIRFSPDVDVLSIVREYQKDPAVEYAEPNYIFYVQEIVPNDPDFTQQWGLEKIRATEGWDIEKGAFNVAIGIIDTGVDWMHPDLASKIWHNIDEIPDNGVDDDSNGYVDDIRGWDFLNIPAGSVFPGEDPGPEDNDPRSLHGHGTFVSGIAAAATDNGIGIAGLAWNCKIMSLRVGYKTPPPNPRGAIVTSAASRALEYAADNGASVVNMSFRGGGGLTYASAVDYAYSLGVVLVGAAGNENSAFAVYPAALAKVLSVAATDEADNRAGFSNYGDWVDVAAPGTNIYSTDLNSSYAFASGTSSSAPLVSGLAALIVSLYPDYSVDDIYDVIKYSAEPIRSDFPIGSGRINVLAALQLQLSSTAVAQIQFPQVNTALFGPIDITGTAVGESYKVEYAGGTSMPLNWIEIGSGTSVNQGTLVNWDNTQLESGLYQIRLSVFDANGVAMDIVHVYLERQMQAGWPVFQQGGINESLKFGDIDGDGDIEIVSDGFVGVNGAIHARHHDGSVVNGWPIILPGDYVLRPVALADLDFNGDLEIIVSGTEDDRSQRYRLYVFKGDGQPFSGNWPQFVPDIPGTPTVGDLDNDGDLEIVVSTWSSIEAFHHTGDAVNGWPIQSKFPSTTLWDGIALGDLDNDGDVEVIASVWQNSSLLKVLDGDGADFSGWPLTFNSQLSAAPTLADFDNFGNLEIAVGAEKTFYIFHHNAQPFGAGWPQSTQKDMWGSIPAVGDVDGDGDVEIAVNEYDRMYLWHHDGSLLSGWPMQFSIRGTPLIGDVDGDGVSEVVAADRQERISAWNHDGSVVNGFPKRAVNMSLTTPVLLDLDGDGDIEIASGTTSGGIFVWDLDTPYDRDKTAWGQSQHDSWNTNNHGLAVPKVRRWSGTINLTTDYVVDKSEILVIEPGTTIKAEPKTGHPLNKIKIRVNGTLKAVGTKDAPIVFTSSSTSPTASDWTGIIINPSSSGSILRHCKIEYAGRSIEYNGFANKPQPIQVDSCEISDFALTGIHVIFGRNTNLVNNVIHKGSEGTTGIYIERSFPTVSGNVIYDIETGISIVRSNVEINNNLILDYGKHGIRSSNSRAQIVNNVILPRWTSATGYPIFEDTFLPQWESTLVLVKNNILSSGTYRTPVHSEASSTARVEVGYNNLLGFPLCERCINTGGNLDNGFPDFKNPAAAPTVSVHDFELNSGSVCIDAGDPATEFNDLEDPNNPGFALSPAKGGLRNDMGIWGGANLPAPIFQTGQTQGSSILAMASKTSGTIRTEEMKASNSAQYLRWHHNYLGQYNVYRAGSTGGPYKKLNSAPLSLNQYYVGNYLQGYYVVRSVRDTIESYNSQELFVISGTAPTFSDNGTLSGTDDSQDGVSVAFGDFNNDDYPDLFVAVPSGTNKLYQNNQDGTFSDLSTTAGITASSRVAIWGDYDSDGYTDLFARQLYRNNRDGTFSDVSGSAGLGGIEECFGASFADTDNDGDLDLFVSQVSPNSCLFFENDGDGTFTEVSDSVGLNIIVDGRESAFADFDNDGDLDLVVTSAQSKENKYLRNNGDGAFSDATSAVGLSNASGVSVGVGDYNNDGFFDIFIADSSASQLYENNGAGFFANVAESAGLVGSGENAKSAKWGDADNDRYLDLYIVNSNPSSANILYRNNGDGTFENISIASDVGNTGDDTKCALADYDQDGDIDIYVARSSNRNVFYSNNGNNNHWLAVKLVGTKSNRSAVGARVMISTASGTQVREVSGGTGSHNGLAVSFGLGTIEQIDSLVVRWPGGLVNTLTTVQSDQFIQITEEETSTFTDIAVNSGLDDLSETNGFAMADYDNDKDLDIYVYNNGSNHLYQNSGSQSFSFTDVTTQAGVSNDSTGGGPAFIDYNNDGFPDLFLANSGLKVLLENQRDGTFLDVSDNSGFVNQGSVNGFAFGDIDNDGYLDLYLANWNSPNVLYKNNGPPNWEFTDMTESAGVGYNGTSHGCIFGDYDNDGDSDIYVTTYTGNNLLYRNNDDGTFTDVAPQAGANFGNRCRGAVFGDYNNDGYLDIYIIRGRFQSKHANVLLKNNGPPDWDFTDVTDQAEVGDTGDGTLSMFGDYNNDGYLDIFVANSGQHPNPENALYRNNGPPAWTFTEIGELANVQEPSFSPGGGFWDYNNDGFLDIFVANSRGLNLLNRNNRNSNHWLKVRLSGTRSNKEGLGTRLKVVAGDLVQIREADGNNPAYHSQSSLPISFGLGKAIQIDSIVVRWPSGLVEVLTSAPIDSTLNITEGFATGIADGDESLLPETYSLSHNYPNPFNPTTTIQYTLPKLTQVQMGIYNILGQRVRTLLDKKQEGGHYTIEWDGTNGQGMLVGSGIYFIRMIAGEFVKTRKMTLLK